VYPVRAVDAAGLPHRPAGGSVEAAQVWQAGGAVGGIAPQQDKGGERIVDKPKTRIQAMKEFFSTPDRPVENKELMEFKKADPEGFEEVAQMVMDQAN